MNPQKYKAQIPRKHRAEVIAGILLVLFLVSSTLILLYDNSRMAAPPNAAVSDAPAQSVLPNIDREETIIARGRVVPVNGAELYLPANTTFTNGVVAEVLVSEGDTVKKGDVLARMDARDLDLRVKAAEAALKEAEANYDGQLNANELERLHRELDAARVLTEAETARLKALADATNIRANAQEARLQGRISVADTLDASASRLFQISEIVETTVLSSQQTLNSTLQMIDSISSSNLIGAQARIDQSKAELDRARLALEQATLRSPTDGTVVQVNLRPNTAIDTRLPAIVIGNLSTWQIVVDQLGELDIAQIQEGESVTVTVDALRDLTLSGTVTHVGGFGVQAEDERDVNYRAVISLTEHEPRLRWNMTASVTFVADN